MDIATLLNLRDVKLLCPVPEAQLLFERMVAREWVGHPFELEIDALTPLPWFDFEKLLGKQMAVRISLGEPQERYFNGFATEIRHAGMAGELSRYHIVLRPWLALLEHRVNSRIFHETTVLDAIRAVVAERGFPLEDQISGPQRKWEYLVQYRESDFNFISRLLEQEGLYYFFKHEAAKHTMVIADTPNALPPLAGYEVVPFFPPEQSQRRERDHLDSWGVSLRTTPGAYAALDFNFKNPTADMNGVLQKPKPHDHAKTEVFDYPGEYADHTQAQQHARVHLEALQSQYQVAHGTGNARGIVAGSLIKVGGAEGGPGAADKKYFVFQTAYQFAVAEYGTGQPHAPGLDCRVAFMAVSDRTAFRLPATTPKPVVPGPQTAVVIGNDGSEIWTDKYGRVRVRFHWDREGKNSCWVRVAQVWAGARWGAMYIPRAGHEVIVDFLEGDPDRPIITGRVYNGTNMPPYALPANQTQSGIKSRSSEAGGPDNFNEIRFEDKKGAEQLYIQAERDQEILVKNDEVITVGHDRRKEIKNDEHVIVGRDRTKDVRQNEATTVGGDRTESVTGSESITIGQSRTEIVGSDETITIAGHRTESVGQNETITISGNRTETVQGSDTVTVAGTRKTTVDKDESVDVSGARTRSTGRDETITIHGKHAIGVGKTATMTAKDRVTVSSDAEIVLKSGDASITLKKDGTIILHGTGIVVDAGDGQILQKGMKIAGN